MMRALLPCVALCFAASALAQADYPSRPVKVIVPLAAAGTGDTLARTVSEEMAKLLGQPFVVENRPGAGGLVGTEVVATAAPDGYTLLAVSPSHVINPALHQKKTYDPLAFEPVILFAHTHQVLLANPSASFSDLKGLIAYDKANPGKLNYGSAGLGSTPYLATELFKSMTGTDVVHVPYKGGAPALADLVAGQLSFMIENVPGSLPLVTDGRLRALAVTSRARTALVPDLPTMNEAGVLGYEMIGWSGVFVAKGTPHAIIDRVAREVAAILGELEMREQLRNLGAEPVGSTPAAFGVFYRSEAERWGKIIKERGIKPE
jgi:tripartite-type tricarboxylate transporter receptor subunit TctC